MLVDADIHKQYKAGGSEREALEMALLEALAKHGTNRSSYKRVKAGNSRISILCFYHALLYNASLNPWMTTTVLKPSGHTMHSASPMIWPSHLMPLQADFLQKCKIVRERLDSKESELHGKWMTEAALRKSKDFSPSDVKNVVSYCKKFPESLTRPANHGSFKRC